MIADLQEQTAKIKESVSLVDLMKEDGREMKRSGAKLFCLCPFHEEETPSCLVTESALHCFGCGAHGDVFDYLKETQKLGFAEARGFLEERAKLRGAASSPSRAVARPTATAQERGKPALPVKLTEDELSELRAMSVALVTDAPLCQRIAAARGWRAETVRALALQVSLGWREGKQAFIYERNAKLRWQEGGERKIRWHWPGHPTGLWREWTLLLPFVRRVYICEGETDAITMLDRGAEDDWRALVLAQPSASSFKPEWAAALAGRDVTLALDADAAGAAGTDRTAALLKPHARTVSVVDWKEALKCL